MPRPRYQRGDQTAYERLSDAFWQLLGEMPYDRITIRLLSERACVNHNTFYYHFKDIDDMSTKMINDTAFYEAIPIFLALDRKNDSIAEAFSLSPDVQIRFERMSMIARNGSARLGMRLRASMMEHWTAAIGRTVEELSGKERFLFNFIIGGLQSAFATVEDFNDLAEVTTYFDASLVWGARETLIDLMANRK